MLSSVASKVSLYIIFLLCIVTCGYRVAYSCNNFPLVFQMATLNFNHIILKLASQGSILQDTLQSQDGLNLGDIHFCPMQQTLCMQHISLDCLWRLVAEGTFMPPTSEGTLELNGTTAILFIFQVDNQHEKITDIYVGLMVHHVESHLYAPDKILNFVSDIEVDLKVVCNALKAGGDPSKRHTFCLFVNTYWGCNVCPYMKDVELDHFNTCNNLARTHLHYCICHTNLQHMNDDPCHCREYGGSHLILPRGVQYKEQLFPKILEPWNHGAPLTDPITKEPFPMELVRDFRSTDPIFKGCYVNSFLYSDMDLGRLRQKGIHLPPYQSEILAPLAPSYLQAKQSEATKQSPSWAAMPNPTVESPKTKCSSGKGGHHRSSGCSSNTSTPKCPDSTSAKKPSNSKEPAPKEQDKSPKSCSSCKCGRSPSLSAESARRKWKEAHTEDTHELNSTLPVSSSGFDDFCSLMGSHREATELQPPTITLTPWVLAPLDNGNLHPKKVGTHWLHFILVTDSTFLDTWWQAPAISRPVSPASQDPTTCPAPGQPACSHQDHLLPT